MVGTKENEIMDYKCFFWDLGESQKEAKEYLVKQYLFIKYGDRDLPYQYTNKLNEAFHYYNLFSDTIYSLSKKLKLDFDGKDEFYESLYSDFRNDGGINTDSILNGYWAYNTIYNK